MSDLPSLPPALPGLSLLEWLDLSETSYSAFARDIPCHPSHVRRVAMDLKNPSYRMACRIETLTGGMVPRTRWYPPNDDPQEENYKLEI